MILSDRQNIIYSQAGNISLCQAGCNFNYYNKTIKTVQCDCSVESFSSDSNPEDLDKKDFGKNFISTILNLNFMVLKCINIVFNFKNIFTNKGRLGMTLIVFFYCVDILIYFINDRNTINKYFEMVLDEKSIGQRMDTSKGNENDKNKNDSFNIEKRRDIQNNIDSTERQNIKIDKNTTNIEKKKTVKIVKSIKNPKIKNNFPPKKKKNAIYKYNRYPIKIKPSYNFFGSIIEISKKDLNKINVISEKKMQERLEKLKISEKEIKNDNKPIKEIDEDEIYNNMNEDELNSLEYEKALKYDKRTFFQYYWSLLKKEQILLFTFLPTNDYNLSSLKITLFIISLSLEFTINGFFFTDDTMHQIHEIHGEFDLFYQIPQILYSFIISFGLNTLVQKLALSEDSFLSLRKIHNHEKALKERETIKKCLRIKFICFIIVSLVLMLFCWYYISCFCAVYTNTQSILFKDTIISILFSMVFPFGLCLLPGICRITSLQSEKKNKKCLYKFSGFFELI